MFREKSKLPNVWRLHYMTNAGYKRVDSPLNSVGQLNYYVGKSIPCSVPGNYELDFMREGILDNIYYSSNVLKLQQLENLHLWYSVNFNSYYAGDELTYLRFEGIDTVADIFLNGEKIGSVDNMFIAHELKARNIVKGNNELIVHIYPSALATRDYELPAACNAQLNNYESLGLRKAASSYGWDIMPRTVSGGIWKDVFLVRKKPTRIDDIFLYTNALKMNSDGVTGESATVTAYFSLAIDDDFLNDYTLTISGKCGDSVFTSTCPIYHTYGRTAITIDKPKLWWCRNAGEANLYDCAALLCYKGKEVDRITLTTGIRTIELSRTSTTNEKGEGDFCFILNGKRVFAMGSNWVPLDAMHSNDCNRLAAAMELVSDVGCNILRVWGGSVYESQNFYDECDRRGIMVWQDFMMGCAVYPQTQDFYDKLSVEVISVVKSLRNHPSLILWAGDNEVDLAYSWAGTKRNPNQNYITRTLIPSLLNAHDFTRPYIPSSPYIDEYCYASGLPAAEEHLWGPRDYFKGEFYSTSVCHFASETGYHGCPSPSSLAKFIAPDQLYPITDDSGVVNKDYLTHATCMQADTSHPYAYRIPLMIRQVETLFNNKFDTLADFSLASQISQAEAKKYFIERFRITRGRRNGIIWWNLLDGWPQISDAVVDYYFTKKLAYHYIKRCQTPVLLAFDEENDGCHTLYAINELPHAVKLSYDITNVTTGEKVLSGSVTVDGEISFPIDSITANGKQEFYLIEWNYIDDGTTKRGVNHYYTHLLNIDFDAYCRDLTKAGLMQKEGF